MTDSAHTSERFDRYEIRRVLGTGAMGSVYAAWDPKLCREVALKVVPSHMARDAKTRARFLREARAIAAVRHPNILEIYDYSGTESPHLYLVIEKLDGQDLFQALHQHGTCPESIALSIAHELCLALEAAHGAGIVHRDIKPENIFVSRRGRVVLTDFGIVKAITKRSAIEGFKEPTEVIGTPGFMAPEQLSTNALGPGVDIFALGVLLYNITTGKMPFSGSNPVDIVRAAQTGNFPDPRLVNPALSADFVALVGACLRPNPKDRPTSAAQLRAECRRLLEELGTSDLREELKAFVGDPRAYRRMAAARAVSRTLAAYKVAVHDGDLLATDRHRLRLALLAPSHPEVRAILIAHQRRETTGTVVESATGVARAHDEVAQPAWRPHHEGRGRLWRRAAAALGLVAVLAGAAWVADSHREQTLGGPLPLAIVRPLPPARASRAGPAVDVDLRVVGQRGPLRLDGRPLAPAGDHQHLHLRAGGHTIEMQRDGAWLRRTFSLAAGLDANVRLDAGSGELTVWGS